MTQQEQQMIDSLIDRFATPRSPTATPKPPPTFSRASARTPTRSTSSRRLCSCSSRRCSPRRRSCRARTSRSRSFATPPAIHRSSLPEAGSTASSAPGLRPRRRLIRDSHQLSAPATAPYAAPSSRRTARPSTRRASATALSAARLPAPPARLRAARLASYPQPGYGYGQPPRWQLPPQRRANGCGSSRRSVPV